MITKIENFYLQLKGLKIRGSKKIWGSSQDEYPLLIRPQTHLIAKANNIDMCLAIDIE